MAQIVYLPKPIPLNTSGDLMAGARLYSYVTATSTPQDLYQDYALTTPHANPVEADANGVFPVMYWGNTARYRLTLKTSADVTMSGYPVDDCGPDTASGLGVPTLAGSNTLTGAWNKIQHTEPRFIIDETDAGTDKRLWDIDVQAGVLKIRTRTDADGSGKDVLSVTRGTGTAISAIALGNATDLPSFTLNGTASFQTSTFVGTLTGCTTSPTATFSYSRSGNVVAISCAAGISATSNTTAMTITGVPSAISPGTAHKGGLCAVLDSGSIQLGTFQVISLAGGGDTIAFYLSVASNPFNNTGTKGLPAYVSFVYELT